MADKKNHTPPDNMGYDAHEGHQDHIDRVGGVRNTASDTTSRQKVDTVALKDRMKKNLSDAKESGNDAIDSVLVGRSKSDIKRNIANNTFDAQADTLRAARQGKIPAKP